MRVFICWSGAVSHKIATAVHEFLGDVIQEVKPFLSSESIRKGGRWRTDIGQQLSEANFGILCLTKDNLTSPWILFEAGALSKNLVEGHVTALLVGIQPTDVVEPLSQFQNTRLDRDDLLRLLKDINQLLPEAKRLEPERLTRIFGRYWPDFERKIAQALKTSASAKSGTPKRTVDDMVAETLELVRELKRASDTPLFTTYIGGAPAFGFGSPASPLSQVGGLLSSFVAGSPNASISPLMQAGAELAKADPQKAQQVQKLVRALKTRSQSTNAPSDQETDRENGDEG